MAKLVFDIEGNGLLDTVTKIWIIVAIDVDSREEFLFSDYDPDLKPIKDGLKLLSEAEALIGHNILGYDLLALRSVLNWEPRKETEIIDTLVYSQVLNYKRFGHGHSLKRWGENLNFSKVEHEDWSQYSEAMKRRCVVDTRLNLKVYEKVISELNSRKNKDKLILGIQTEQSVASFCAEAEMYGWPFDLEKAYVLKEKLEKRMIEIKEFIEPQLKKKIKQLDKDPEYKSPAWIANGNYAARTANWFSIDAWRGVSERPIWGDYCRVETIEPEIGSLEAIKELLLSLGWKPTEWNYVEKNGKLVQSTPKITEDSVQNLGRVGKEVVENLTLRARYSILEGWLQSVRNGKLHGSIFPIGTPTFRARHNIIANIPSEGSDFGHEFRELFSCSPGYVIVGADSSGNQLRGLAHYIDDPNFTKEIIEGDIHTFNQKIIESVTGPLGESGRKIAKTFIYAFLYAAGEGKLGLIVKGYRDTELGSQLKSVFMKKIPGLGRLIERIEKQYNTSFNALGRGYIQGLDGRPVYLEAKRLALNYLLQSCEKITCAAAIHTLIGYLRDENIFYQPLTWQHDEIQIMVREKDEQRVKDLAKKAFAEGPKMFGVTIMDGESKSGKNWSETH